METYDTWKTHDGNRWITHRKRMICWLLSCSTSPYDQQQPEGIHTLNNASILNSVGLTDAQTAFVVSAMVLIPDNVVLTASSCGVHTTCKSITSQFSLHTTGNSDPLGFLTCGETFYILIPMMLIQSACLETISKLQANSLYHRQSF